MVYHFVKHIGFDIKADSLEQAKEIAEAIDDYDDEGNSIKDVAMDTMFDAIDDALDVGILREDFYDNCDAHVGNTEYVGYTEDEDTDDPEERLYDHLTEDEDDYDYDEDEDYDEDDDYDEDEDDDSDDMTSDEKYLEALASRMAYALISSLI